MDETQTKQDIHLKFGWNAITVTTLGEIAEMARDNPKQVIIFKPNENLYQPTGRDI